MMKRFFSENRLAFMDGGSPGGPSESGKTETLAPVTTPMLPPVMIPTAEQNAVNPAISANPATPAMPESAMPTAANAIPSQTATLQAQPGVPETAPAMPQMGQNPEGLKPVTAEDAKKATTAALEKGQRIGNSGLTKIETLARITPEQFNIPA